jgi:hypothetical protein
MLVVPTLLLRSVLAASIALLCSLGSCQRGQSPTSPPAPPVPPPPAPVPPPAPAGSPSIEFDERVHDFGLVNEGTDLKHKFVIKNVGNAVLKIENVTTSCGCTAATAGIDEIPPGGQGPLEVTFRTQSFAGPGSKGIQVATNDPRHPVSSLEIKYDVQRLLLFESMFVTLTTARGRDHVEKVWLTGSLADKARLRVVKIQGGEQQVLAKPIAERRDGKPRKGLELKLKGGKPLAGGGDITVTTGLPNPAELVLRFNATVNG